MFLLFVGLAVLGGGLATGSALTGRARLGVFVLVVAGWVVSLCLHEFAHALLAYRAGDTDVLSAGYLTLNPLRFAHPVLSLLLPLVFIVTGGIGLPGGAVYLHRHRFRTRAAHTYVSLAGPAVNLVLGVVLLRLTASHAGFTGVPDQHLGLWGGLAFLGFLQIFAAVLNLVPVPGLDGWAAIEPFVSASTARAAGSVKPYGLFVLILVLYVPVINTAFFDLVDHIVSLTGASPVLAQVGRALFEFWRAF